MSSLSPLKGSERPAHNYAFTGKDGTPRAKRTRLRITPLRKDGSQGGICELFEPFKRRRRAIYPDILRRWKKRGSPIARH